jgi:DNA-binding SARP family transcriptional activator
MAPKVRDELDPELLEVFLTEAADLLPAVATGLRGLASAPNDRELARDVMRKLHTIKCSARMAGAVRLGELAGDESVATARSLLAAMRVSEADYAGAVADVGPLLSARSSLDSSQLADVLYPAIGAYGFLGDREGLDLCQDAARLCIEDQSVGNFRVARLEMAMGIIAGCFDGDHRRSAELLQAAIAHPDVPLHWRFRALSNYSACALECGDLDSVRAAHSDLAAIGSAFSTPLDRKLPQLVAAVMASAIGERGPLRQTIAEVVSLCEADGEAFTLATTCAVAAQAALAAGDSEYARRLADKGLTASAATGSPVLLWFAELMHALVSLAGGASDRAESVARRILPLAEGVGAMGHVLHCRLILAVAVLKSGDFAQAIEHLSALSDHIVRTQPILALATYVTVFPNLLGALAIAVGVDDLPDRLFDLLTGARGALAVHQAAVVLSPAEQEVLCSRMRAVNPTDSDAVQEPEAICRVRLFGGLEVVTPRGQVGERDWSKRKARLLFAMLVSRMGTDVPRGEIIEYLWPDMQEERALNNFYVVWSAMKRAISPESIRDTPCPYVEHVRGVCRIVKQHVISDLEEFSDLVSIARQARHDGDVEGELAALRALADVYRGEVLPGDVYDDWFAPLRDRFRHDFEDAMLRASTILEEQGDPHGGLQLLRRAMAADPWREDLYQAQLRMQIAAGQRSAAIETYMLCRSRLTADLGIDPSRETTALYERVLGMEEPEGLSRV